MEKVENTTPTATKTNATDNAFKNGTIRRLIGSTKVKDLQTVQAKGVVKNMSSTSPTTTPPRNKSISCHSNAKAKEESSWLSRRKYRVSKHHTPKNFSWNETVVAGTVLFPLYTSVFHL